MPVHLAMRFADMDALLAIAREHKLVVIEDCAHAHGGQFQGRGAGAAGDAGCFSFQESKLMTAGEGGMVITNELGLLRSPPVHHQLRPPQPDRPVRHQSARGELPHDRTAGRLAHRPA